MVVDIQLAQQEWEVTEDTVLVAVEEVEHLAQEQLQVVVMVAMAGLWW